MFKTLGKRGCRRLAAASIVRTLAPGAVLWHAGEKPPHICLVSEDMLQMVKVSRHGNTASLALVLPGEAFGCVFFLLDHSIFSDLSAFAKSVVVLIPGRLAFDIGKNNPGWFKAMAVQLSALLVRQDRFRAICAMTAKEKIPSLLICLRDLTGESELKLTQADIAKLAALSEETVNRTLSRLKKRGIVAVSRGTISIVNPSLLMKLAAGI